MKFKNNDVLNILHSNNYELVELNNHLNSTNGICKKNNERFFFKFLDLNSGKKELKGYNLLENGKYFKVCKLIQVEETKNNILIVFKYEDYIQDNKGLLIDYFENNDVENINDLLNIYDITYKNSVISNNYPMNKFYKERLNSRLYKWYNDNKYKKKINNGKSIYQIIEEVNDYFKENNTYRCYLTQGDPNCLNLCTNGLVVDYETSGYNPVEAELAALFWSVLFNDSYFAPKYNSKSFIHHDLITKNYKKYLPKIKYIETKNDISVNCRLLTSSKRKQFINDYLKILKDNNIEIKEDIKYFLILRILGIFNINIMDIDDYYYILYFVDYIYNNINEDVYKSIEIIINEVGVIDEFIL